MLGLLEADPSNTLARDYLLCYDLLRFNLDEFVEDFTREGMPEAPIYKQAILIWLIQQKELTDQNMARYNIDKSYADQMQRFLRYPDSYKNTYWYFYFNAIQD